GFCGLTHYPYDLLSPFPFLFPFSSFLLLPSAHIPIAFAVPRRKALSLILSTYFLSEAGLALAKQSPVFREYVDTFDGYSFKYPGNWIQVRGAG
ncbi:hypothetical protein EI012_27845, partial [Escherichia coli]|nr:hypothetical protein [Escherichia coli]